MDKIKVYQPVIEGSYGPQFTDSNSAMDEIVSFMISELNNEFLKEENIHPVTIREILIQASGIDEIHSDFDTKIVNMFDMKYVIIIKKMTREEYDSLPEFDSY